MQRYDYRNVGSYRHGGLNSVEMVNKENESITCFNYSESGGTVPMKP